MNGKQINCFVNEFSVLKFVSIFSLLENMIVLDNLDESHRQMSYIFNTISYA